MSDTCTMHHTTVSGNRVVMMNDKEYEAWVAIQHLRNRTAGRYGSALVQFVGGHIQVYGVATQPERVK